MPSVVFGVNATVNDDGGLDLRTTANHAFSFDAVRRAMAIVRDELTRILDEGPARCPFSGHAGDEAAK